MESVKSEGNTEGVKMEFTISKMMRNTSCAKHCSASSVIFWLLEQGKGIMVIGSNLWVGLHENPV